MTTYVDGITAGADGAHIRKYNAWCVLVIIIKQHTQRKLSAYLPTSVCVLIDAIISNCKHQKLALAHGIVRSFAANAWLCRWVRGAGWDRKLMGSSVISSSESNDTAHVDAKVYDLHMLGKSEQIVLKRLGAEASEKAGDIAAFKMQLPGACSLVHLIIYVSHADDCFSRAPLRIIQQHANCLRPCLIVPGCSFITRRKAQDCPTKCFYEKSVLYILFSNTASQGLRAGRELAADQPC